MSAILIDNFDSVEPGELLERLNRKTDFIDPYRFDRPEYFKNMMLETLAHKVSDIYIQPGLPVVVKLHGKLKAVTKGNLDSSEIKGILKILTDRDTAITDIISQKPVNDRYELFDPVKLDSRGGRVRYAYRVNASPIAHHGDTSCQIVIRAIPENPPLLEEVGLELEIFNQMTPSDGIVYVAGTTGSGKTTTFAAVCRRILEYDTPIKGNLLSHEEPIEYSYGNIQSKHSIFLQSQIPSHFTDFYKANREAMRRAPGLVLIGELRDEETIRAAIELSLTGHPVFATVHAGTVAATTRRLISRFPESERATAIYDIVETTRFMMAQRLVPSTDGKQVAAREYLAFDEEMREELMSMSDMGRVTAMVKKFVKEKGHSFAAEADRLLEAGLIDQIVARKLRVS